MLPIRDIDQQREAARGLIAQGDSCKDPTLEFPTRESVEKHPRLRSRQGMYSVIGMDGRILKRGHDLRAVLRVLERKLIRAVNPD